MQVFRRRKEAKGEFDCRDYFGGNKRGWTTMDAFTAGAVMAVFNALSPEMQEKAKRLHPATLIEFAWKHVK